MTDRRIHHPPGGGAEDEDASGEWMRKGATLSDGTASREFGLTREEIVAAIRRGRLQYRVGSIYGNPFLRLLRREVEALVAGKRGGPSLEECRARTELARVDRELRSLRRRAAALERERARLLADLGE